MVATWNLQFRLHFPSHLILKVLRMEGEKEGGETKVRGKLSGRQPKEREREEWGRREGVRGEGEK